MSKNIYDFAILGGGLYGMTLTKLLKNKFPGSKILLLDQKMRVQLLQENSFYIPVRSGEMCNNMTNNKKINLLEKGYKKLEQFCEENKINFDRQGELIIAHTKEERERMSLIYEQNKLQIQSKENQNIFSNYLEEIDLKKAIELEPLLKKKELELAKFYHFKNTSLVDMNKIKNIFLEEIYDLNQKNIIEVKYSTQVKQIERSLEDKIFKIKTINVKPNTEQVFESKIVFNATGAEALNLSHQLNLFKNYSSLKIYSEYFHANIPAKEKYPNLIISSPNYTIHPGLSLYLDQENFKTAGPVFNTTDKSYSFFNKLKTMNEWRKVYQIFHEKNIDPQMEYKYNSGNYVYLFFAQLYGFPMNRLFHRDNKVKFESSVMYSLTDKIIQEDFIIEKQDNFVNMLNFNHNGGFTAFLPACEEAVDLV